MPAQPGGPPVTGPPVTPPPGFAGPDGWYLLRYLNGAFAVVYLKSRVWQFTGGNVPNGTRTATPYFLGTSGSAISNNPAPLNKLLADLHVTGIAQAVIMNFIGENVIGHSVYVTPSGQSTGFKHGTTGGQASDILPNIPNPLDALSGLFSGWADLLVRVLEALVGVALLFLGLQALTGTGGQGMPIQTVKRYAR